MFFLSELDEELDKLGLFYVRYMDDILVLAPTLWKLRQAIRAVHQVLASLQLAKHPDKTYIGRIEKGFDFPGYHFRPGKLGVAKKTIEDFVARVHRLYEQGQEKPDGASALGDYVRRWVRWVRGGVIALQNTGKSHHLRSRLAPRCDANLALLRIRSEHGNASSSASVLKVHSRSTVVLKAAYRAYSSCY